MGKLRPLTGGCKMAAVTGRLFYWSRQCHINLCLFLKFFFENQDIFENLIREIYLIYAEATNNSIEDANNLCKYIENNSGKFLAFIPNKVLENIDLLIRFNFEFFNFKQWQGL